MHIYMNYDFRDILLIYVFLSGLTFKKNDETVL